MFKTAPLRHQLEEFELTKNKPHWGLLWEMGTGKGWEILAHVSHLANAGEINGFFNLAPRGMHNDWVIEQIPTHLSLENVKSFAWMTSKAGTNKHAQAAREVLEHDGFACLSMSYDAIMTEPGQKFAKLFLTRRRCLYDLDESPKIKTPGAKRTIRVLASGKYAPYRRIASGTIVDDKPFDVYSQIKFLDADAWKEVGCSDFAAFKATFGIWKQQELGGGREFPLLVGYRNLELLKQIVAKHGSRLLKQDVLDLPPKMYAKRTFELSPAQRRAYDQLRDNFYTFCDSGLVSAELAITRLLRFQQITSGYLPTDDAEDGALVSLCDPNPRVQLLVECVEDCGHQFIVWAKYRQDIASIVAALRAAGITCVQYNGQCSDDELIEAKRAFKAGEAQGFVGNPGKGAEGLTLNMAKTMIYFNNSFKLSHRLQSEDRFHRIGQDSPVLIIDLAAIDTVDDAIIDTLRSKYEMAAYIQGDTIKQWI